MGNNTKPERKWIFVLVSSILLLSSIVFFILTRLNIDKYPSIAIIGGADGPTAIFVSSPFNAVYFVFTALAFITADLFILAVIKIVENKKDRKLKLRYKAVILIFFNILADVVLLPSAFAISTVSIIVITMVFTVKYFIDKRIKTPNV